MTQKPSKYRSQMRIYVDIMRVVQREENHAKPTRILYGANLSHDRLVKHLSELIALGVIEEVPDGDDRFYKLTQKGVEFLNQYRSVERFASAFGFVI